LFADFGEDPDDPIVDGTYFDLLLDAVLEVVIGSIMAVDQLEGLLVDNDGL